MRIYREINRLVASFFYTGFSKYAPGTVSSLLCLPMFFLIHALLGEIYILITSFILLPIGVFVTAKYIEFYKENKKSSDPKEVTIDEVVGIGISLSLIMFIDKISDNPIFYPIEKAYHFAENYNLNLGLIYLIAFLLFRFFDILKPYPISLIDQKMKNPLGVMLDDVAAAIAAGLTFLIGGIILKSLL